MKKFITLLVAMSVFCVGNIAAQSADYAHWSVAVKGGINYYRIKPDAGRPDWSMFETRVNNASWSLPIISIDYTVNPYYGFGFEGGWFNYNREGLKGSTIDIMFNNSVNLSNLLAPTRQGFWKKSTFYGNAALGVGFHKNKPIGSLNAMKETDGITPIVVTGLEYNYNFTSHLALILEGQYRAYLVDGLGIAPPTNWNDDGFAANIGLRLKFHGKNKTHVRDASVGEYYADLFGGKTAAAEVPAIASNEGKIKALEDKINDLQNQLAALSKKLDGMAGKPADSADPNPEIARLNDKIRQLENDLNNKAIGTQVTASFDEIRFSTGSAKLTGDSEYVLARIVHILKDGAGSRKIRIFGYTDNVGSADFNLRLSQQRAEAVKNFLIFHGVAEESIIEVKGMGMANPIADNRFAAGRAQNRRVSFVIE